MRRDRFAVDHLARPGACVGEELPRIRPGPDTAAGRRKAAPVIRQSCGVLLRVINRAAPRRRNCSLALRNNQHSSTWGWCTSSAGFSLRASVSSSRSPDGLQPRNTNVRTRGVPSPATLASCNQPEPGARPSRWRAPRSKGLHGGSESTGPLISGHHSAKDPERSAGAPSSLRSKNASVAVDVKQ